MPVKVFFCYAHEDELLLNKLKTHLKPLQRMGLIDVWHDRDISAGMKWEEEIDKHLNEANIILLLISPDFMGSDYCYGIEMQRALERDKRGEARVIPIILRPVDFEGTPLRKLQALPTDAKAVMSSSWQYHDEAFVNVTKGIREVVEELTTETTAIVPKSQVPKLEPLQTSVDTLMPVSAKPLSPVMFDDFSSLRTLAGHEASITSIAFSPNGQFLASGSEDETVKLWNPYTGEEILTFTRFVPGLVFPITSITFSPNGQFLAGSTGFKKWSDTAVHAISQYLVPSIKIWNAHTGELLHNLSGHKASITSIAFSPDGQFLASSSDDKTIQIWARNN